MRKSKVVDVKNRVFIDSKLEICTCGYLWMFFTKEGLNKKKKMIMQWLKTKPTNPRIELVCTRLERGLLTIARKKPCFKGERYKDTK